MAPRPEAIVSILRQGVDLSAMIPGSRLKMESTKLDWTGILRPTRRSVLYEVSLTYSLCFEPEVRVLYPALVPRAGFLPHYYHDTERLCLYDAGKHQWDASMMIGDTIIPWTSEWLYFYEFWRGTGNWFGDPTSPMCTSRRRR
jgi:hypothetical protein